MTLSRKSEGGCSSFMVRICSVLLLPVVLSTVLIQARPVLPNSTATDTLTSKLESEDTVMAGEADQPRMCITLEKGGEIIIELYPEEAPLAVERIINLVREQFFDGLSFHRVESYLVQAGRKESELPSLEGEMFGQRLRHEEGMVGMARLPNDYDSATNQFYICKKSLPQLNGEYTLFGCVVEGMEIVHKMKKGTKIERITTCTDE